MSWCRTPKLGGYHRAGVECRPSSDQSDAEAAGTPGMPRVMRQGLPLQQAFAQATWEGEGSRECGIENAVSTREREKDGGKLTVEGAAGAANTEAPSALGESPSEVMCQHGMADVRSEQGLCRARRQPPRMAPRVD